MTARVRSQGRISILAALAFLIFGLIFWALGKLGLIRL